MASEPLNTALEQALRACYSIIPVGTDKRPLIPEWKPYQNKAAASIEVQGWLEKQPAAWAIVTGAVSRVFVLDFDGDYGNATMAALGLSPHVRTGSGGHHAYFHHPGVPVATVSGRSKEALRKKYPGTDVRGDGGYAVFWGRNTAGPYEWLRPMEPDPIEILPDDLLAILGLNRPPESQAVANPGTSGSINGSGRVDQEELIRRALDQVAGGSGRNDAGFWLAIQLRDNGYSESEATGIMRSYVARVPTTNTKGKLELYTEDEALDSLTQAYSRPARAPWGGHNGAPPRRVDSSDEGTAIADATEDDNPIPLPVIIVNDRELRDVSADFLTALQQRNDPPILFVRSGRMVSVVCDEKGRPPSIAEVSEAYLRGRMTRSADVQQRYRTKKGNWVE